MRRLTATLLCCALAGHAVPAAAQPTPGPQQLVEQLKNAAASQRADAARALGRARARSALRPLLVCAQVDPQQEVREACADAVLRIDSRAFASKLASADPPPVAEPVYPLRPRSRYATLFLLGLTDDLRRAGDSLGGSASFGLRWGDVELQLALGFPAMSLGLRGRWLMIRYPRLTPYLSAGGLITYNEDDAQRREAVSVAVGLGVRYYVIPPIFCQLEVMVGWAAHAPVRRGSTPASGVEDRRWSVPLLFEVGLELWP